MTNDERPDLATMMRAANDVVDSLGPLWRLFRSYRRVAVRAEVYVAMTSPTSPVKIRDDQPAPIRVVFLDDEGAQTNQLPAGTTLALTTDNPALATTTVNADGMSGMLTVTPGWDQQATKVVNVSMTSPFQSQPVPVEIDPTVAVSGEIVISANP